MESYSTNKIINDNIQNIKNDMNNIEHVKQVIVNIYKDNGFILKSKPKKSKLGGYYVDCGYGMERKYNKLVLVEQLSNTKCLMERKRYTTTNQIILDDDFEIFINSLEIAIHEAKIWRGY